MVHIVFQQADIEALQKSFELDENFSGDIVQIQDDLAVGPIADIYTEEGRQARKQWWREVLEGGDYDGLVDRETADDTALVTELISRLNADENEVIWIWAAQNKHDVCGYYWLMSQLKEYQGRIFILYLNNLPFINEKGNIFYPNNLFEIPAKEFLKARKLAREITLSEFEVDPDEWTKLCNESRGVRLLEGGKKLMQADADYYDAAIKKYSSTDWQKASKVIHQFLNKEKELTGDAYLLWRIKWMIGQGIFDVQGNAGNMKDFEIKLPGKMFPEHYETITE